MKPRDEYLNDRVLEMEVGLREAKAKLAASEAGAAALRFAGQTVLDGLNDRLRFFAACKGPMPIYAGIADLHTALNSSDAGKALLERVAKLEKALRVVAVRADTCIEILTDIAARDGFADIARYAREPFR